MDNDSPLRQLPSMDRLLKDDAAVDLISGYGRNATRDALRIALDAARQWISQGGVAPQPVNHSKRMTLARVDCDPFAFAAFDVHAKLG